MLTTDGGADKEASRRGAPSWRIGVDIGGTFTDLVVTGTAGSVHVSVDGGPLLTVDNLSRLRPTQIAEIRYLNSSDAAQRFGTSAASGGVILVRSK